MPTAAKLVAAIALGLAAWAASKVLLFHSEALQKEGVSHMFFGIVGFVVGWKKLGPSAEQGYIGGWSGGISAAIGVWMACALIGACHHVYRGFAFHAYKNVDEMMDSLISRTIEYASLITTWQVLVAALVGGMLAGTFAAMAGRVWN